MSVNQYKDGELIPIAGSGGGASQKELDALVKQANKLQEGLTELQTKIVELGSSVDTLKTGNLPAVGKDGYIAYPEIRSNSISISKVGLLCLKTPFILRSINSLYLKFNVSMHVNKANSDVDYFIGAYLYEGEVSNGQSMAIAIGNHNGEYSNIPIIFGEDSEGHFVVIFGDTPINWRTPMISVSNISTRSFKEDSYKYEDINGEWDLSVIDALDKITIGYRVQNAILRNYPPASSTTEGTVKLTDISTVTDSTGLALPASEKNPNVERSLAQQILQLKERIGQEISITGNNKIRITPALNPNNATEADMHSYLIILRKMAGIRGSLFYVSGYGPGTDLRNKVCSLINDEYEEISIKIDGMDYIISLDDKSSSAYKFNVLTLLGGVPTITVIRP